MKKALSLILTLTLVIIFGSVCFAEEGDTSIIDAGMPGAPAAVQEESEINVDTATYDEPKTNITDEEVAEGSVKVSDLNEEVPKASALPKTGGIPAEAFYAAGALFIVAALIISRKKVKTASKD